MPVFTQPIIRECTSPLCRFRYPTDLANKRASRCPKCGSATRVAVTNLEQVHASGRLASLQPFILEALLDNIRSTFNVGAIFRSADGAGFHHLHLCGITPTPQHPKIKKTALGAEGFLPWSYYNNSLVAAQQLKASGACLWALECLPEAVPLYQAVQDVPDRPLVLVAGNELIGIDPELLSMCDRTIEIPMDGSKESLNVAVAFSIAAYTVRYCHLSAAVHFDK